jgi:hypothetical protein
VAVNPTGFPLTPTFNFRNFPTVAWVVPWMTSPDVSLAIQPAVMVTNAAFAYTLPALSVVTFVGQTNFPPALAAVPNQTINAGNVLTVTNTASDPDLPAQSLSFALLAAPANAALSLASPTNALVTWRPSVSQANTTNLFSVKVSDNGSPGLSATNHFSVIVNPLGSLPMVNSITPAAGNRFDLTVTGPSGPDYSLLTSTNLFSWQWVLTSNSPALPLVLTTTNNNESSRFYRIEIGP